MRHHDTDGGRKKDAVLLALTLHRTKEVNRPQNLFAAYDPRNANSVYLLPKKNSTEFWICNLTKRSREFSRSSFYDVWLVQKTQKKVIAKSRLESEKEKRKLEKFIEEKINKAEKLHPGSRGLSKKERVGNIRENRKKAVQRERQNAHFVTPKKEKGKIADIIPIKTEEQESGKYPEYIPELFYED